MYRFVRLQLLCISCASSIYYSYVLSFLCLVDLLHLSCFSLQHYQVCGCQQLQDFLGEALAIIT